MLELVVLAAAGIAGFLGVARLMRRAKPAGFRDGLSGHPLSMLFGNSSPAGDEDYTPDTGDLTRQIVRAMRKLGHISIAQPVRALAPHLHVEGTEVDINAIIDFEPTILADIQAYVKANGQRYRWTLDGRPTLSYSVAQDAAPGVLRFTRNRPPRCSATPEQPGRPDDRNRVAGPASVGYPDARQAITPGGPSPAAARIRATAVPPLPTRRLGIGRREGTAAGAGGQLRLFRIGGGNVYHLTPGLNIAGRDPDRCDIVLGFDDAVSAVHAEIAVRDDGNVTVRDLGSSNGTALHGQSVTAGPARLSHGDVLTIGTTRLRFIHGNSQLAPTANMTTHE